MPFRRAMAWLMMSLPLLVPAITMVLPGSALRKSAASELTSTLALRILSSEKRTAFVIGLPLVFHYFSHGVAEKLHGVFRRIAAGFQNFHCLVKCFHPIDRFRNHRRADFFKFHVMPGHRHYGFHRIADT